MSDTPRIEVTIAAPLDTVWAALRDKDTIRHWHGWDYDGLDGEIDLIYFSHATEDTEARTLSVQDGDLIKLEPVGEDATRVTLTRAPRGVNPDWDAYYGEITEGWITFLHQLRFAVERRPGAVRRTLFFNGTNKLGRSLERELGLPAGGTFEANLVGEHVKGETWYRAEHQFGVTVDAWGDGLLVLSSVGPFDSRPDGIAMAILSTYGLDDARFADLTRRWTAWWDERFPSAE
jgi:uncharacterized protein YndB with AHSA1/START domain